MFDYLKKFEKTIVASLMVMMALVLLLSTIELGWIILNDIISPPVFLLNINELLELFGLFMLVLIGIGKGSASRKHWPGSNDHCT